MTQEKECPKHGITTHVLDTQNYFRCRKCRVEAVTNRRKKVKKELKQLHGGKCKICGYSKCLEALEFHHVDATKKSFAVCNGGCLTMSILKKETEKCVLLCANCHREVEMKITTVD